MENTETYNGAEIVIKTLIDQGVDTIFGYPGGANLPLYDELFKQNQIKHVLVRHEQAAVHAAEAYARSTGKVGVVLVTSGPGATNTITGLTDALMDSIPLVCITGQVFSHLIGSDAFQEADTIGLTISCTKHNYMVKDVDNISHTLHEAFHVANTGRPGPVVVDIPKDMQLATGIYDPSQHTHRPSYKPAFSADDKAILEALDLIASAKRPVFYTGGGVINAGPEASILLTEFVHMIGAPITSTLMGLGCFPASDKQFLKMLGMHGSYEANMCMAECDVMINIGARFDDRITGKLEEFSPHSKKIHVDIDASSVNKNVFVDVAVIADAGEALKRMITLWKEKDYSVDQTALDAWWKQVETWRARNSISYRQHGDIIKPQYALDRLNTAIKGKNAYISTDVGQHQMWTAQYIDFEKPNRWMTSGGLGTMGYGLPAAIGTQIAHPDELVVCVSGEASLMMNLQELATAKQYRLPVKIVILNNQYMGMVRQWQEMFHGNRYSESYMETIPDFVALAGSHGIKGMRVEHPDKVDQTIQEMIEHDGPVVLDIRVDREENVYPMIPSGHAHNDMDLGPECAEGRNNETGQVYE